MIEASATDVVLLCAGRGERLRPFTDRIPKVLIPVKGTPLLGHQLRAFNSAGFRRAVVVVGHMAAGVQDYVAGSSGFGLNVLYCAQNEARGTGDAVRCALDLVRSDPFLVIYGDVYLPSLDEVLAEFTATNEFKLAGARVNDASDFGRIVTDSRVGGDYLVRIIEKDGARSPGLVNAGLYLLPLSIGTSLERIPPSTRGEFELPDALEKQVQSGISFRVVPIDQWVDVGTTERLEYAEQLPQT